MQRFELKNLQLFSILSFREKFLNHNLLIQHKQAGHFG